MTELSEAWVPEWIHGAERSLPYPTPSPPHLRQSTLPVLELPWVEISWDLLLCVTSASVSLTDLMPPNILDKHKNILCCLSYYFKKVDTSYKQEDYALSGGVLVYTCSLRVIIN
jgi:hypothetical protein